MNHIGIIGAGMISRSHANAIKAIPTAVLSAVCDIDEKSASVLAAENDGCPHYTTPEAMFAAHPELDTVIIAAPTFVHRPIVAVCAAHGKNILCEKPLALSVDDVEAILDSVHNASVVFMTAQVVRFWPGYAEIMEMKNNGELGDIYLAYATRCSVMQAWGNTWLVDPKRGQGAILDMHVHDIDYLRALLGPADYVFCAAKKDETQCFNSAFSTIAFKNGTKAVAQTSFNMQGAYPFSMSLQLVGTKATVEMVYRAGENIGERGAVDSEIKIYRGGQPAEVTPLPQYDAYTKQLEYFLDCVNSGRQPERVPHEENLDVIKIACAIRDSAEQEAKIQL